MNYVLGPAALNGVLGPARYLQSTERERLVNTETAWKQLETKLMPICSCLLTSERSELPSTHRPRKSTSRGRAENAIMTRGRAENAIMTRGRAKDAVQR